MMETENQSVLSGCGKAMNGRYVKRLILFPAVILAVCMLCGCELGKIYNNTNCYVYSVYGSNAGTSYICENETDVFVYQRTDSGGEIYNATKSEPIVTLADYGINYMAASNDVLFYGTGTNEGMLFGYSLSHDTMLYEIEDYAVYGMKTCENDVFVTVKAKEYKDDEAAYDVLLFQGEKDYIHLNEIILGLNPVKKQDSFLFYSYEGYMVVADEALYENALQIVYIEKNTFQYSCLPYNTYMYHADMMYCIEAQPDFLPEVFQGDGGIDSSMVFEQDGTCLFVAQYNRSTTVPGVSTYQHNPSATDVKANYLCRYNMATKVIEVLYKAKKGEQIGSFSPKGDIVYLLKNEGIYKKNIITGKTSLLLENEFKDEGHNIGTYVFENHGDKLAIFSMSQRTQAITFVMEIPY